MAKINISGELFDWDPSVNPMSEALAVEAELGMPFEQYQQALAAGSAKAMCGFVWLVLRRNGRDVPLADILSGEFEVDVRLLYQSLIDGAMERQAVQDEPPPGPTEGPGSGPAGTPTTATATSGPSPSG